MVKDFIIIGSTAIIASILWSKYVDPWLDSGGFKNCILLAKKKKEVR